MAEAGPIAKTAKTVFTILGVILVITVGFMILPSFTGMLTSGLSGTISSLSSGLSASASGMIGLRSAMSMFTTSTVGLILQLVLLVFVVVFGAWLGKAVVAKFKS